MSDNTSLIINRPVAKWIIESFYNKNCLDYSYGFTYNNQAHNPNHTIVKNTFLNLCFLFCQTTSADNITYITFTMTEEYIQYMNPHIQFRPSLANNNDIDINTNNQNLFYIFFLDFFTRIWETKREESTIEYCYKGFNVKIPTPPSPDPWGSIESDIGEHNIDYSILVNDFNYVLNCLGYSSCCEYFDLSSLDYMVNPHNFTREMRSIPVAIFNEQIFVNYLKLAVGVENLKYK